MCSKRSTCFAVSSSPSHCLRYSPSIDAVFDENRQGVADDTEVIEEVLVFELRVVDRSHDRFELGRVVAGREERADDRARRSAGDAIDLVAAFFEHRDRAHEPDAFDSAAFEHQICGQGNHCYPPCEPGREQWNTRLQRRAIARA